MDQDQNKGSCLVTLVQSAAWFITSVAAVLDMLYIRQAILSVLAAIQAAQGLAFHAAGGVGLDFSTDFGVTLVDKLLIFILGVGTIVAVVAIEYFFRKGQPKGLLYKRIGLVVAIEAGIFVLSVIAMNIA
jgi:hypothetical protein